MATNTSTAGDEETLEALSPVSDQTSTEQSNDESPATTDVSIDSKFMTKTNQKLADQSKLNSYLLRGFTPQDIKDQDPELAERLKRHKDFEDIFLDEEDPEDQGTIIKKEVSSQLGQKDLDDQRHRAIQSLTVDGKLLSSGDIKLLKKNETFKKRYDALTSGGYDPYEAANEAFEKAFPQHAERVGRTILNGSSQDTPYTKSTPDFSDADRKLMKAHGIKEDEVEI